MRILHAVHDYLPDQVAGVEVYTNRVTQHLAGKHDVAVLFATLDPGRRTGSVESLADGSVELFALAQNRDWTRFQQTWDDPRVVQGIGTVLDRFEPDVVHIQHLMNLGIGWLVELESRAIPTVMTLHDQWWACAAGGQRFRPDRGRCDDLVADRCAACTSTLVGPALALRGLAQRRAASRSGSPADPGPGTGHRAQATSIATTRARSLWAGLVGLGGAAHIEKRWASMRGSLDRIDAFIAPSDEIRDRAIEFGFPTERIIRLPHGLPARVVEASPLPDHCLRFGYVGSLVPHKGVHQLIEAFAQLPAEATLDIYGSLDDSPEYARELAGLIRHPGIRLCGERAPEEIYSVLASLDVLVAPSIWRENAPLTVQEAFVVGRPVVASNLGGHKELLTSGGGLLFEPGDVNSLAGVLLRLVREKGLGRRLASRVPSVRTIEEHVEDLGAIYRRVSKRSPTRPARPEGEGSVVFLDRDGVINRDSPDFIRSVHDWEPLPGSLEAIARLSRAGYRVFVITNQSGIARSLLGEDALAGIHAALEQGVSALGGRIEAILYCPHAPEAGCDCRKPRTGLIEQACRNHAVDARDAPFVGDRITDLMAARDSGCRAVFVRSGAGRESELGAQWQDVPRFDDLSAFVDVLLGPAGLATAASDSMSRAHHAG